MPLAEKSRTWFLQTPEPAPGAHEWEQRANGEGCRAAPEQVACGFRWFEPAQGNAWPGRKERQQRCDTPEEVTQRTTRASTSGLRYPSGVLGVVIREGYQELAVRSMNTR